MNFKYSGKRAGISLIEVLVVLVLLTIGILSVIRLFPPGFLINKQVAEATAAARLSKQEMDRFSNGSSNLMDAIVPIIPIASGSGYVFGFDTGATPDDLTEADSNTYGSFTPYFSDVNKVRRIIGENVRIPLPTSTTLGRGSVYMLSSGPFMDVSWDGQNRSIFIYGANMSRYGGDVTQLDAASLRPNAYAIDYSTNKMMFPIATYDRQFLLNISYYNTSNVLIQLVDIAVPVSAYNGDWVTIPSLPSDFKSFAEYTDTCSRKFTEITPGNPWATNDPYQFYLDPNNSPRIGTANSVGANFGVVVFNPLGRDYGVDTPTGRQPLTARIDYDVLDWHIIHEDRPLPASTPYQVSLSLRDLKKLGDFEDDQTTFQDLFSGVTRSGSGPFANPADVMVFNASDGTFVPPAAYTVNHREGSVTFTDAFGNGNASATMRIFYRAHGDWALQIQKAASSYRQHYAADGSAGLNEFYLGTGAANGGNATRIYFPLSEAGKTVSIREFWYRNASGQNIRVANESYRINSNRTAFEILNQTTKQPLTWVDVTEKHGDAVGFDTSSSGYAALGVQGISFRTRVLWKNGSSVTATSTGNVVQSRWRHADLDTVLTRSAP